MVTIRNQARGLITQITGSLCLGVALLVGFAGAAQAATYHVSPNGSNTPPYSTPATAAQNPSQANSLATGYSDTVLLHAGDYPIPSSIEVAVGVTWIGDDSASVILRWTGGSEPPIWIVRGAGDNLFRGVCFLNPNPEDENALVGLTTSNDGNLSLTVEQSWFSACELGVGGLGTAQVRNSLFDVWQGDGIHLVVPSDVHIYGNRFVSGPGTAGTGKAIYAGAGDILIEDNVIDYGPAQGRGFGIYVDRFPTSATVRNNLIMGSRWPLVWDGVDGVVENNTFWAGREMLFWLDLADTLVFRNNIVYGLAERIYPHNPCSPCLVFVHNAFWPPEDSIYDPYPGQIDPADTANISAYPMFEDDSLFRLQAGSPMIDRGDPTVLDMDLSRSDVGWTGGPGGITYQYSQLPPGPPDSLWVNGSDGLVDLTWSSRPEADLAEYRVYRGTTPGFWIPGMMPHRTYPASDTTAQDTLLETGESYYYVVTAVDTAGLEGTPSPEGGYIVSGIFDDPGDSPIPRTPQVIRVYPNPFNSATTMEVVIPAIGAMPAPVRVTLYDLTGRIVATPFEGRLGPGQQSIPLSIRTSDGSELAAGVYFVRLRVWNTEFGRAQKLVLLK